MQVQLANNLDTQYLPAYLAHYLRAYTTNGHLRCLRGFGSGIKKAVLSVGVSVPGVAFSVAFNMLRCECIMANIFFFSAFFCVVSVPVRVALFFSKGYTAMCCL